MVPATEQRTPCDCCHQVMSEVISQEEIDYNLLFHFVNIARNTVASTENAPRLMAPVSFAVVHGAEVTHVQESMGGAVTIVDTRFATTVLIIEQVQCVRVATSPSVWSAWFPAEEFVVQAIIVIL